MPHHRLVSACSLTLALALVLTMPSAWAQWAWRDSNGTVQYSDTPPPSSVPQDRIVRQPGSTASATPKPAVSENGTPSWVEKNAEFMKRREERQEQEKKAKEQKQADDEHKKNCDVARENLRLYETGRPVRQGQELMSDSQRQAEIARMRKYLQKCR